MKKVFTLFFAFIVSCQIVQLKDRVHIHKDSQVKNSLKIDGYFYKIGKGKNINEIQGFILYRDGSVYISNVLVPKIGINSHTHFQKYIKKPIIASNNWGVFKIEQNNLVIQNYYNQGRIFPPMAYFYLIEGEGKVINDTTVYIDTWYKFNENGKMATNIPGGIYKFKQHSFKPDSIKDNWMKTSGHFDIE